MNTSNLLKSSLLPACFTAAVQSYGAATFYTNETDFLNALNASNLDYTLEEFDQYVSYDDDPANATEIASGGSLGGTTYESISFLTGELSNPLFVDSNRILTSGDFNYLTTGTVDS